MPKNKISDLRNLLFETMERLLDDDDDRMDVARAKALADVAQTVINTAKVEIDFLKQTGHGGTGFIQDGLPPAKNNFTPRELPETAGMSNEDLCLNCKLPECNEASPFCLVTIERRAKAAA